MGPRLSMTRAIFHSCACLAYHSAWVPTLSLPHGPYEPQGGEPSLHYYGVAF